MALKTACEVFVPMLSAFIDGELSRDERVNVERHLAACSDCAARAADLRAASALVRVGLEIHADQVDFRDFSQRVMARLTPERPPLLERWKLSLGELFTYRRGAIASFAAAATAAAVVGVFSAVKTGSPEGYASPRMAVQAVSTDPEAHVAPVVMKSEGGDAIIWLVSHRHSVEPTGGPRSEDVQVEELDMEAKPAKQSSPPQPKLNQERPRGGEL
ncbi:MAG TPA: zf-HC2 domain-containing protein [Myxococcaceae bacterium]|nr:zf-HC2 domain-containing protein [Myxococcaceae bacterium]